MTSLFRKRALPVWAFACASVAALAQPAPVRGGRLVVALRSEAKTLNAVYAVDEPSRAVAALIGAPLLRINPETQAAEGLLAESWTVTPDGREITVRLRRGLKFSDGASLTAADVQFTFAVHTDARVASPQRQSLEVGGQPVRVRLRDERSLVFTLAGPYALGERMLAGAAILPKHLLEPPYRAGRLASVWGLNTPAGEIAGAGPFRLKSYQPGQRIVLERNPHYARQDAAGTPLPYLDEVEFVFTAGEDAQIARFLSGAADLIAGFSPASWRALESAARRGLIRLGDAGPGLDYTFLLFNLNPSSEVGASPREWFGRKEFRQAISSLIDREAIVRLVYRNRASAIRSFVTPARKPWFNEQLRSPQNPVATARRLLRAAGFDWDEEGKLKDARGAPVAFTILVNSANPAYAQTAAVIEQDLNAIGITARATPIEFRSLVDRVMNRRDFETAVMALRPGDADPAADMNVLVSGGRTRLWNTSGKADRPWEAEIDRLMSEQIRTRDEARRRVLFHRVQQVLAEHEPMVFLASPNVLYAARSGIANLRAAPAGDPLLWNVDELFRLPPR